jgi:hypothetical protein
VLFDIGLVEAAEVWFDEGAAGSVMWHSVRGSLRVVRVIVVVRGSKRRRVLPMLEPGMLNAANRRV